MANENKLVLFWKESWLLVVCSLIFGLLLASVNYTLQPKIQQNKIDKLNQSLKKVLPEAENFEQVIDKKKFEFANEKISVYKAENSGKTSGWAFTASGPGYADTIKLLIAVNAEFENILGYNVLMSNETAGFGSKIKSPYYKNQFEGAPAKELELIKMGDETVIDKEIVAVSGATISSKAVVKIFNKHLSGIREKLTEEGLIDE
ncbi:FMN-binding protein [Sedimentisphaera salicampi]|uniref:Ion-translocating oxidoreductase complex subunit G n=1 Tax=Sedimentisphaera salicampi TaxID=1941349 RepID=A0A1W6LJ71_9BACT|nr:FMN-binding protein [Sedimentisphaera salicampi]ARN55809.1 Nitrogen fixation protein RnfG [Sedimentisphaera salicampi]OXU16002.1 Nitrogen fixation protein RnfG [Sedimentisphaera salicampi]